MLYSLALGMFALGTDLFVMAGVLPRIAADLILTGRQLSAEEAVRHGVVSEVVPDAELADRARTRAERLAANAPRALREIKRLVRLAADTP